MEFNYQTQGIRTTAETLDVSQKTQRRQKKLFDDKNPSATNMRQGLTWQFGMRLLETDA